MIIIMYTTAEINILILPERKRTKHIHIYKIVAFLKSAILKTWYAS